MTTPQETLRDRISALKVQKHTAEVSAKFHQEHLEKDLLDIKDFEREIFLYEYALAKLDGELTDEIKEKARQYVEENEHHD